MAKESNFDFERTSSFSITAWVKRQYSNLKNRSLVSKGNMSSTFKGYILGLDNSNTDSKERIKLEIINNFSSNRLLAETSTDISDHVGTGVWHHIAATYNGSGDVSGINLYIDGIVDTVPLVNTLGTNTILTDFPFEIGKSQDCDYWDGSIDEVTVWNRVLSLAEIQALAQN